MLRVVCTHLHNACLGVADIATAASAAAAAAAAAARTTTFACGGRVGQASSSAWVQIRPSEVEHATLKTRNFEILRALNDTAPRTPPFQSELLRVSACQKYSPGGLTETLSSHTHMLKKRSRRKEKRPPPHTLHVCMYRYMCNFLSTLQRKTYVCDGDSKRRGETSGLWATGAASDRKNNARGSPALPALRERRGRRSAQLAHALLAGSVPNFLHSLGKIKKKHTHTHQRARWKTGVRKGSIERISKNTRHDAMGQDEPAES